MNKFRKPGFINYNGHLEVHSSLLSVVLAEQSRSVENQKLESEPEPQSVVEGVESEHQRAFLMNEGCDQVQGYLTGRPLPITNYHELLGHQPARGAGIKHQAV